jgi:hypothetical protein
VIVHLRAREATNRPPKGPVGVLLKEGVLLFNTVPGLLSGNLRVAEDLGGVVPLVGGNWLASWGVAIAHDLQVKRIQ